MQLGAMIIGDKWQDLGLDKFSFIRQLNREKIAKDFMNAEDLFHALHVQFKASALVNFHGTYSIEEDDLIEPKEHTHILAEELWKVTGYRFT
ncbi:hypothetical protein F5148DRAFT_1379008 [Russula earlei]|uniref:Uncharacterized protein n=1 Tax=Russula earlei TaxID=71964 RepID=A0ACC0TWU9_9AGAM|nr:hypothetical protein F5148DRAFT_1379008 [Russula earlei]